MVCVCVCVCVEQNSMLLTLLIILEGCLEEEVFQPSSETEGWGIGPEIWG